VECISPIAQQWKCRPAKLFSLSMIWKRAGHGSRVVQGMHCGRAIAQAGLVKWDLWWTKWRWGRFSPSTSVSPSNLHSTKFSIIIITRGWYNRPFSGRRAEWTQFGLHPPLCELKNIGMHCLRSLGRSDCVFESHSRHGCLVFVCVFLCFCTGRDLATS
jgi:hypothetical protein